ncbi:MAG: M24 family metallopeptidase [Actinomycetota bacterium]
MPVSLRECALPVTEVPTTPPPPLTAAIYKARIAATRERARAEGVDVLVVWGDREHSSNMSYLSGFDPRFEEALLIVPVANSRPPRLLVGNECLGFSPDPAIGIEVELWQELSLMGQPRERSRMLRDIFAEEGVVAGAHVGCIGWKTYSPALIGSNGQRSSAQAIDVPAYVVDLLRELTTASGSVVNSTGMLMNVDGGLRLINEPEQIRLFEYAACVSSAGMMSLLKRVRPGVREDELERELDSRGLTLSCHRMVGFGEKARRGLASASSNAAKQGDALTTAFGVAGALTCRAGAVASGPHEMPDVSRDFYERFFTNYFAVARAWYAALHLGATGGEVFAAAESVRDTSLFDFALNPGHYLHLDEWVNSPFAAGNSVQLRSGMAMQVDIIPVSKGPFVYVNLEDGVALADDELRAKLTQLDPTLMQRVARRRDYMINTLGYELDACVLPLGNTSGWLAPYVTNLSLALTHT